MFRKVSLSFGLLATGLLVTAACQPVQPVSALEAQAADKAGEGKQGCRRAVLRRSCQSKGLQRL